MKLRNRAHTVECDRQTDRQTDDCEVIIGPANALSVPADKGPALRQESNQNMSKHKSTHDTILSFLSVNSGFDQQHFTVS